MAERRIAEAFYAAGHEVRVLMVNKIDTFLRHRCYVRYRRLSIRQVGLVRVEAVRIIRECRILVRPPENFCFDWFESIHGLIASGTEDAPYFPEVVP